MKSAKPAPRKLSLRPHTLAVLSLGELTNAVRGGADSIDGHCTLTDALALCAAGQVSLEKRRV